MFTAIGFQVKLQLKMCIKLHHSTHTQRGLNKCLSDKLTCLRSPRNVHGVCLHLQAKRQTCGVHIRCPEQPLSGPWVLSHHLPVPITTPHTKQMKLKPSSEKCFKIGTVFIIKNWLADPQTHPIAMFMKQRGTNYIHSTWSQPHTNETDTPLTNHRGLTATTLCFRICYNHHPLCCTGFLCGYSCNFSNTPFYIRLITFSTLK